MQLIRDDDARCSFDRKQQLSKEAQSCPTVSSWLNQNIDDCSALIYGAPQIVLDSIHLDEYLIQVPPRSDPS